MNNWAVVYTSVTGNTEKLAKAMAEELGCDCFTTDNAPEDLSKYDVIVAGYWLRLGGPADKMKAFLDISSKCIVDEPGIILLPTAKVRLILSLL